MATAIIVPVPEVESTADLWRRRYTEDGADGMPAHVTLLWPFVNEELLVAGQVRELRAILGGFQPFEFALTDFAEFPAAETTASVLYLTPEPAEPFRAMTAALVNAFPGYPPYGGEFESVIPHLTLACASEASLAEVRESVASALPIRATATEARVMRHGHDGWRTKSTIHLGREEIDYRDEPLLM